METIPEIISYLNEKGRAIGGKYENYEDLAISTLDSRFEDFPEFELQRALEQFLKTKELELARGNPMNANFPYEPYTPSIERIGIPPNFDGDSATLSNYEDPETPEFFKRQAEIKARIEKLWNEYERSEFKRLNSAEKNSAIEFDNSTFSTKDAIDPSHYKEMYPGLQWMHTQWFKSGDTADRIAMLLGINLSDNERFIVQREVYIAKNVMQSDKYTARLGKKNAVLEELRKSQWYLKAAELADAGPHHEDGRPFLPDEV